MIFDMHVHTANISHCALVDAEKVALIYKQAGYDGIVITNHYHREFIEYMGGEYRRAAEKSVYEFKRAQGAAEKLNLKCFFGMEICLDSDNKNDNYEIEYLIYGLTEDFLLDNPDIIKLTQRELYAICLSKGFSLYQAHPFRAYCRLADINYLDGIESLNTNKRHYGHNDIAKKYAEIKNLRTVQGSDYHILGDDIAKMRLPDNIKTNGELAAFLRR